VKMPIEFSNRPPTQAANQKSPSPVVYVLLICVGFAAAMMLTRWKRA
jgi:hypothetical protein